MIGIYKITNPKGRVYIGQSINIEKRSKIYKKEDCRGQPKLHGSLVKYGFSQHNFEVIEECTTEELNVRERYWQDFYEVLSEKGLNCMLTETAEAKQVRSQESINKSLLGFQALLLTPEGQKMQAKKVATLKAFLITPKGIEMKRSRSIKIALTEKVANTDYQAIARKNWKPIRQYSKEGEIIQEWSSSTEASTSTGVNQGSISSCCKQKLKSAGGFIWKYF